MDIINIESAADFQEQVLEAEGKVVVDFWAAWCGPCQMMAPVMHELAEKYNITVCKVNVDEVSEPAMEYRVDAIPAFFLFENGTAKAKAVGAMPADALAQRLGL